MGCVGVDRLFSFTQPPHYEEDLYQTHIGEICNNKKNICFIVNRKWKQTKMSVNKASVLALELSPKTLETWRKYSRGWVLHTELLLKLFVSFQRHESHFLPVVIWANPLAPELSRWSEGNQAHVLQLLQIVRLYRENSVSTSQGGGNKMWEQAYILVLTLILTWLIIIFFKKKRMEKFQSQVRGGDAKQASVLL